MNGNQIEQGRAALARLTQEERKKLVGSLKVMHGRKLKREAEAATALTEATSADPANAEAWLLGATLARRQGKLDEAPRQIEKAADLAPLDPDIGLEAGVIAALSGRDEAARKSWQSVIGAAPASAQAGKAKAYLEQLGPLPAASGK